MHAPLKKNEVLWSVTPLCREGNFWLLTPHTTTNLCHWPPEAQHLWAVKTQCHSSGCLQTTREAQRPSGWRLPLFSSRPSYQRGQRLLWCRRPVSKCVALADLGVSCVEDATCVNSTALSTSMASDVCWVSCLPVLCCSVGPRGPGLDLSGEPHQVEAEAGGSGH